MSIRTVPFLDVFEDASGGNVKTPQSEYLPSGEFPVVDQGKALIAGYVDDKSRLCGNGLPAIVFGDHTRCVKYVGFPFCMGADGVKVLRPKIEADLKYLYYFLKQLEIPNAGYDRHYKYLKRTEVVLQALPEQRRIAAILDQADALRAKRREALAQLDSLTQSIFIEMFGDPRKQGSTGRIRTRPIPLGTMTRIRTGKLDANAADDHGEFPFFTCAVKTLRINSAAFDCRAVLVAGNGDLNVKYHEGKFNAYQRTYVIESINETALLPEFLYAFLDIYVSELRKQAIGGVIKYIKLPYLTDAVIQLPPEEWQQAFVSRFDAVAKIRVKLSKSLV